MQFYHGGGRRPWNRRSLTVCRGASVAPPKFSRSLYLPLLPIYVLLPCKPNLSFRFTPRESFSLRRVSSLSFFPSFYGDRGMRLVFFLKFQLATLSAVFDNFQVTSNRYDLCKIITELNIHLIDEKFETNLSFFFNTITGRLVPLVRQCRLGGSFRLDEFQVHPKMRFHSTC